MPIKVPSKVNRIIRAAAGVSCAALLGASLGSDAGALGSIDWSWGSSDGGNANNFKPAPKTTAPTVTPPATRNSTPSSAAPTTTSVATPPAINFDPNGNPIEDPHGKPGTDDPYVVNPNGENIKVTQKFPPKPNEVYRQGTDSGWDFLDKVDFATPGSRLIMVNPKTNERSHCSTGWIAKSARGEIYIITAGHCGEVGTRVLLPEGNSKVNVEIGTIVLQEYDLAQNKDIALIRVTQVHRVRPEFQLPNPGVREFLFPNQLRNDRPIICNLGYKSGLACGRVIGMTTDNRTVDYLGYSKAGDSGGAVFALNNKGEVFPVGVVSRGYPNTLTRVLSTTLAETMLTYGLELVLNKEQLDLTYRVPCYGVGCYVERSIAVREETPERLYPVTDKPNAHLVSPWSDPFWPKDAVPKNLEKLD